MGKDKYENKSKTAEVVIPLSKLEDALLELFEDCDSEIHCLLKEIIHREIPKYFKKCKKRVENRGRRRCDAETTYHDQDEEEEEEEDEF